jgi:SAM-dependent methyltransferase
MHHRDLAKTEAVTGSAAGGRDLKRQVQEFWELRSCGEAYAEGDSLQKQLAAQARTRYQLEPYIPGFAGFPKGAGLRVLEIGVGMGADHLEWARARPAALVGVDFSARAVKYTRARAWNCSGSLRTSWSQTLRTSLSTTDHLNWSIPGVCFIILPIRSAPFGKSIGC